MFLRRPRRAYPWPPRGTVDRHLELAVLDYAPGSETVRDKQVHTAVGLAAYRPAGTRVIADNPIGRPHRITLCRRCGTVRRRPPLGDLPIACLECSASAPDFVAMDLAEPAGFRSAFRPDDFEGSFTRSAVGHHAACRRGSLVHGAARHQRGHELSAGQGTSSSSTTTAVASIALRPRKTTTRGYPSTCGRTRKPALAFTSLEG